MKKTLLVVAILVAAPAFTQEVEHAPTVAQCVADQRLWGSKLNDYSKGGHGLDDVTVQTLIAWEREMGQCDVVDPESSRKYDLTQAAAVFAESNREVKFLSRHGLWTQFLKEDSEGQR